MTLKRLILTSTRITGAILLTVNLGLGSATWAQDASAPVVPGTPPAPKPEVPAVPPPAPVIPPPAVVAPVADEGSVSPAATEATASDSSAPEAGTSVVPSVDLAPADAGEVVEPAKENTEMSLQQILQTGGWLLWALAAMSVVGLSFVVYFLLVLTRRNVTPPDFVKDVQMMLSYNRITEAKKACSKSRSPSAAIAMAGIDYIEKVDDPDPAMMREILEGEGGRQASLMQNQVTYLLDIGVIAPMVGLLGTVFGMVKTFNVVALDIAKAKPIELAAGVSQALITTAGGLLVGIPAMLAYAYFRGRAAKLISNMEVVATEFLTALVNRKK